MIETMITFAIWAVAIVILAILVRAGNVVRYIPNDQVGIVEKIFSRHGSIKSGFIALDGEAGFQPDIVRGGVHFFWPFVYRVHKKPLVTIPQGTLGYVFARDGAPLAPRRATSGRSPPRPGASTRR
jgi:uncharacterized membrane protein YqiK